MMGHIKTSMVEVEAHSLHEFEAEGLLPVDCKWAGKRPERARRAPPRLGVKSLWNETFQKGLEVSEYAADVG
jgi:hypothetical protein